MYHGIVPRGSRVAIPQTLREDLMDRIHAGDNIADQVSPSEWAEGMTKVLWSSNFFLDWENGKWG